jgi:hypothetical protein
LGDHERMRDGHILIAIGLVGIGFALHALWSGETSVVWSRLGGWGSLESRATRDERPMLFWSTVLLYGISGLLLAGFGAYRLLHHQ